MKLLLLIFAFSTSLKASEVNLSSWTDLILSKFGPSWIESKPDPEPASSQNYLSLRLPMCFFFEEGVNEKEANSKLAFIKEAYSLCGIKLETSAFKMKGNYPSEPKLLMALARHACPFTEKLGVRGAIQIETKREMIPREMCQDGKAEGCSTLCEPVSFSVLTSKTGYRMAFHETLHSNCCGPTCVDRGMGNGRRVGWGVEFGYGSQVGESLGEGEELVTGELCDSLRKGATTTDISSWTVTDSSATYFRRQGVVDLTLKENLLEKRYVTTPSIPPPWYSRGPKKNSLESRHARRAPRNFRN